jgi:endonuclease I
MKLRTPLKITSRTSSITNSFVQAIIPTVSCSEEDRAEALAKLGMTIENLSCVYCGSQTTDWDHLRPLFQNSRPTGYNSEAKNLVPSCGPCNQSKGAADWKVWMMGNARGSPTTRGVEDVADRVAASRNSYPGEMSCRCNSRIWFRPRCGAIIGANLARSRTQCARRKRRPRWCANTS